MYHSDGFSEQKAIEFVFCDYPLLLPSGHVLAGFFDPASPMFQPYRETGLVKVAQALQHCGRVGTAIDIGANVGDTCAILHRHSNLKIVSIDASDFFFPYLASNVERLFNDRAVARHAYVLPTRADLPKGLYHWGGTAKAVDAPFTEHCEAIAIGDLLSSVSDTALLKIDIDGFDMQLLSGMFDNRDGTGPAAPRFPIYFEYEFAGDSAEQAGARSRDSLAFFDQACAAGYTKAFVWDDPGRFFGLIDLHDRMGIVNAINYMGHFRHRVIYGYDICLVHESDDGFLTALSCLVSRDAVIALDQVGPAAP